MKIGRENMFAEIQHVVCHSRRESPQPAQASVLMPTIQLLLEIFIAGFLFSDHNSYFC